MWLFLYMPPGMLRSKLKTETLYRSTGDVSRAVSALLQLKIHNTPKVLRFLPSSLFPVAPGGITLP